MEPEKLANLLRRNNISAFKYFFEGFYPSVCVFAQKYVKDLGIAEDVAQEAFIEYWNRKENFTDVKAIKGFIYTVTRNKCINHIKLNGIRENILKNEVFTENFFYELILEEETYKILHKAIDQLAPQSKKIIWLSLEGSNNQSISEQLDISVNTVKTLKKNAYKQLRIELKDQIFILFLLSYFLK